MLERSVNRGKLQIIKETIAIPILGKNKAGLDTPLATVSHNNMTRQGLIEGGNRSQLYTVEPLFRSQGTPSGSRQENSNPGFGTQKTCPFPVNRAVPSEEVTDTKHMWTFFRTNFFDP